MRPGVRFNIMKRVVWPFVLGYALLVLITRAMEAAGRTRVPAIPTAGARDRGSVCSVGSFRGSTASASEKFGRDSSPTHRLEVPSREGPRGRSRLFTISWESSIPPWDSAGLIRLWPTSVKRRSGTGWPREGGPYGADREGRVIPMSPAWPALLTVQAANRSGGRRPAGAVVGLPASRGQYRHRIASARRTAHHTASTEVAAGYEVVAVTSPSISSSRLSRFDTWALGRDFLSARLQHG